MMLTPCARRSLTTCDQPLGLGQGQGRRRLVHDQDLGVERQGLGDLDHLLLGEREPVQRRVRREGAGRAGPGNGWASARIRARSTRRSGPPVSGSRPRKTLPATSRLSRTFSSWWMKLTPARWESVTPRMTTGRPLMRISPSSGWWTPPRIFIRVLLPAPFSPIRATTSPRADFQADVLEGLDAGEALGDALHRQHRRRTRPATPAGPGAITRLRQLLVQVGHVGVQVVLLDGLGRDDDQLAGRDAALVALGELVQQLDGLVAERVRVLDDGAVDGAALDAVQRALLLVEADDLDLADLAGVLDGAGDGGAVVAPDADQAGQVRVLDQRVGGVGLGAGVVGVVGADVEDLECWSPLRASRMPWMRSLAFWASLLPTKIMILPPWGMASLISPPAMTPAAWLSVPM